jgi:Ran GTPase-activating protein (RanGAP) involved in mRNA processing and transport
VDSPTITHRVGVFHIALLIASDGLASICVIQLIVMPSRKVENDEASTPNEMGSPSTTSPTSRYIQDEEFRNLYSYKIGNEGARHVANELATNITLKDLNLSNNDIGDDGAAALARALAVNESLTTLRMWFNRIGDIGMDALGQALMQNNSLQCLDVGDNNFGTVGLTSFARGLKINTGLTWLSLHSNSIDKVGAAMLADALTENTKLEGLGLYHNRIGNEGATALGEALEVNTTLTSLILYGNNEGDEGATSILTALTGYNSTLTRLDWSYCSISFHIHQAVQAFIDANKAGIRVLHAHGKLDLSSKGIDYSKAKTVAKELADNMTVTTLVLNRNRISSLGSPDIAEALKKNRILTSVELDDNFLHDTGSLAIAAMLRENCVLMKLSLNGNDIGLASATAIAESLRKNSTLKELGLGRNRIFNDGAAAIADALSYNTAVDRLGLDGNGIGDKGAVALLALLGQRKHTLKSLNLDNNSEIRPALRKTIDVVLTSRLVLNCFRKRLRKPLGKELLPLVIHAIQWNSTCHGTRAHCQATRAGPVFLLVRAAALNDLKAMKMTA